MRTVRAITPRQPKKMTGVDNTFLADKIAVRRHVLAALAREGIRDPRILDVFAGMGHMWRQAYQRTPRYVGLDKRYTHDTRHMIVCDALRFLRHSDFSVQAFDLFDIDAYGSPAAALALLCHRLALPPGRVVGIVLTDGTGFAAKKNSMARGLLHYLNMQRQKGGHFQHEYREYIIRRLFDKTAETAGGKVEQLVRLDPAGKGRGSQMWYIGYLMRGV